MRVNKNCESIVQGICSEEPIRNKMGQWTQKKIYIGDKLFPLEGHEAIERFFFYEKLFKVYVLKYYVSGSILIRFGLFGQITSI